MKLFTDAMEGLPEGWKVSFLFGKKSIFFVGSKIQILLAQPADKFVQVRSLVDPKAEGKTVRHYLSPECRVTCFNMLFVFVLVRHYIIRVI